jgi:hypothetical protein
MILGEIKRRTTTDRRCSFIVCIRTTSETRDLTYIHRALAGSIDVSTTYARALVISTDLSAPGQLSGPTASAHHRTRCESKSAMLRAN